MASITFIPTGERLFIEPSDSLCLAIGLKMKKGVRVTVHLDREQARKLHRAIGIVIRRRTRRQKPGPPSPMPNGPEPSDVRTRR
jgi:hypothetical protein